MATVLPLDQMTVTEKLRALEELWDDLRRNPADVSSPDWHGDTLREREERIAEGKSRFTAWPEAKEEIRKLAK
jgi:hypothetical protein